MSPHSRGEKREQVSAASERNRRTLGDIMQLWVQADAQMAACHRHTRQASHEHTEHVTTKTLQAWATAALTHTCPDTMSSAERRMSGYHRPDVADVSVSDSGTCSRR